MPNLIKMPNISDYSNNKIVCSFYKERSPYSLLIVDDIEDSWFKYIINHKTKTGEIVDTSMIIASDLKSWTKFLENSGYKLKK